MEMRNFINDIGREYLRVHRSDTRAFRVALDEQYKKATPVVMTAQERDELEDLMKAERRALTQALSEEDSLSPQEKRAWMIQREVFKRVASPDVLMMEMTPIDNQLQRLVEQLDNLKQNEWREKGNNWSDLGTLTEWTKLHNELLKLITEHDRRVKQILDRCPARYATMEIEELRGWFDDRKVDLSNIKDSEDNTLLHCAKQNRRQKVGIYLTLEGIKVAQLNRNGATVLNVERSEDDKIIDDPSLGDSFSGGMNLFVHAVLAKVSKDDDAVEALRGRLKLLYTDLYDIFHEALAGYSGLVERQKNKMSNAFLKWIYKCLGVSSERLEERYWLANDAVIYRIGNLDLKSLGNDVGRMSNRKVRKLIGEALQEGEEKEHFYFPPLTQQQGGELIALLTSIERREREKEQEVVREKEENEGKREEEKREAKERLKREAKKREAKEQTERLEQEEKHARELKAEMERLEREAKEREEKLKAETERLEREAKEQRKETDGLREDFDQLSQWVKQLMKEKEEKGLEESSRELREESGKGSGPEFFRR